MNSSKNENRLLLPARFMLAFIWIMGGSLNMIDMSTPDAADRYGTLLGQVWSKGLKIELQVPSTIYLSDTIPENPIPFARTILSDIVAPNIKIFLLMISISPCLIGV